jgi:hypothetical protein
MTITLTREEAQQMLDALEDVTDGAEEPHKTKEAIETLRARLTAPEPVPTGFIRTLVKIHTDGTETWKDEPFYTTPTQREWQGLTDEEIDEAHETTMSFYGFARAIEAKLREKNDS